MALSCSLAKRYELGSSVYATSGSLLSFTFAIVQFISGTCHFFPVIWIILSLRYVNTIVYFWGGCLELNECGKFLSTLDDSITSSKTHFLLFTDLMSSESVYVALSPYGRMLRYLHFHVYCHSTVTNINQHRAR